MEKKVISNDEIIPPIINDRVSPTNNNLKKSVIHNLEKNEVSPRKKLILQEKLKLKKLQIKKDNLDLLKYKNEKTNYPFNPTHQSVNSANMENTNENNNNNPYKIFIKKIKVKILKFKIFL